jgi:hypothetical protein
VTIAYNSNYNETIPFSDSAYQVNCSVGVAQSITVPGANTIQYQALFSYIQNSNVFVRLNTMPLSPTAGSVGTQPYSEFRPNKRYVRGGDVIYLITPDANAYVGVSLRKLQG